MSLDKKLFDIASTAVEQQRKARDSRNPVSKGFDVATNKSYANDDKKTAAAALRNWENRTWKPKIATKLKQEMQTRAPHLKPGTKAYNQTYESLYNKNYKDLQSAKAKAQQQIGTLRKPQQTQRQLDNDYRTKESVRNDTVGVQAASHAARDTVSAVGGALATGASRLLRAPLQLAADVGENDDGGIFDRGAKALEGYEDNLSKNVYGAYGDIQENGSFSQKLAISAVEQVPALAASFGAAGAAAKGVQLIGAGAKGAAAASYGTAAASMYPQAYLDGSDSTKQELEGATAEQLASAERSQDIYKGMFEKNIKAGMSEDEAYAKARDQTISEIAEQSGDNVGLATLAISMLAPGVGSFTANRVAGGAVSTWGQKVFNKLAVRADSGKVAKVAIPTAVGAGIVGLNVAEEGLQEGYTDYVAQQAAVDVGVKDKINAEQSREAILMGGILGGLMGGGVYLGTRNSKLHHAQDDLKTAQQAYAEVASQIPQLQEQIDIVSPRSEQGQALTARLEATKAALDNMAAAAQQSGIPRTSLARRAPRIEPTNSTDQNFDGGVDGSVEVDAQGFDNALNPQGTPVERAAPVIESRPTEQELDAQDAQLAELIAEQALLDESIEDNSAGKPLEESIAAAQSWYADKRGENKEGLAGVASRATAKIEDTAFAEQQKSIAGTTASINDYIANQRAQQQQIDAEIEQAAIDAKTDREKKAVEQLKRQREIDRAQEEELIAKRAELAQPHDGELFDTTVIGADGAPFNLARFWDNGMPAAAKTKLIANAFDGQVEQNIAKADWSTLPEGVQRELHQWMSARLDDLRQERAGQVAQEQQPASTPVMEDTTPSVANGLAMPTIGEQPQASQLTDQNPTINIPAPNATTNTNQTVDNGSVRKSVDKSVDLPDGVYKSKPAARAAMKKQKLDPKKTSVIKTDDGWTLVESTPATRAQAVVDSRNANREAQESANTTTPRNSKQYAELLAANSKKATKKDGSPKYFLSDYKSQQFIIDNDIGATHEVVDRMEGKQERFEILPKKSNNYDADNNSQSQFQATESDRNDQESRSGTADEPAVAGVNQEGQSGTKEARTKADRFANNTLFTADKVAAARARLKSKLTQVNSGLDPEILMDGMTLAGAYIESGVRKFSDYAKMMIEDVGADVKPYLLSFWEGTRHYPGLDTEGMTSAEESKRMFDALDATINDNDNSTQESKSDDAGTSEPNDRSSVDAGLPIADQANEESRNAGQSQAESTSDMDAIDGASTRSDTIRSDGDSRPTTESQRSDADDSNSRTDSAQSNDGATETADASPTVKAKNHVIDSADTTEKLSWQKVAERNVSIVELIKTLDSEGRQASASEQALLAKYAGWGASEVANGIFPNPQTGKYKSDSWQALGNKLKSLLTDSEYDTARRTTQYAHYTPPVLVDGIYKALEQFGFKGGQVLEPASGIGVFNGLMPRSLADNSSYVGLELDPITGRIAQYLYPESNMKIDDYIKAKLPDNHFDVAVGNPPFAGISVDYKGAGKNSKKQSMQLHDYFFAKTLDKLKPGGVMAFVTSKGTMDKKGSGVREYLAQQADLIGAIRLPQTAFKENAGTEVVTDVIFLRKRHDGEQPSDTAWASVKSIDIDGKPSLINEYFANNPEMVLGKHAIVSGRFGDTYTVQPNKGDFAKQLDSAISKLPKDMINPARGSRAEAVKVADLDYGQNSAVNKEGGVYLKDGNLLRVVDGVGKPLTQRYGTNGKPIDLTVKDIAFLKDYVGVREALKKAQYDQLNDSATWEDSLAELNTTYDAFVKEHGPLMAHSVSERENSDGTTTVTKRFKNKQRLFLDVEGVLASALENIVDDGKGTVEKGSFFSGRSLRKPKMPTIKGTQDAMVYTLDEKGVLDIDRIAGLVNKSRDQIIEELGDQIYQDPQSKEWDLAETYLSGNVVAKLEAAEKVAKTNKAYSRNVAALKAVQPAPIAPNDISSNMGAAWIPGDVIGQFSQEVLAADVKASYSSAVGLWDVGGSSRSSDYATADRSTVQLVESILNNRSIVIKRKTADGETFTDSVATELANEVARKIKTEFKKWLWSDDARTQELAEYYNKTYNNIVPPSFNGDHLTLAGMSNKIQLRAPQKQGIYRVIRQGDVYLNHAVGAGKTFTMIAAAMEEKRLGLINKPMFVVPNHMLDQFSQEFLMLYPAANIMVADEQNFHTHNRKQFVAQAALNTPDAIIITHSGFERIGVKPDTKQAFLKNKIEEWQAALEATKESDSDNRTSVKQLERNVESLERNLDELLDAKEKDGAVYFEDMGIDKIYIDEAHEFRKLNFVTKMGNIKGIDPAGSQRAMDLDMKLQLLRQTKPTRAFVGASGTPVTNTMGELYTIQRYFQPDQLSQDGLDHFDVWANQFGEVVEGLEQNAAGNYEVVPRFAKFVNVPELMSRVRSFMDVLTSNDLSDFVVRPSVRTGGREIVTIPTPDGFSEYQKSLSDRIDAIRRRSGKPEKGDDIILSVIGDGRFSAIDMRFVDPTLPSDPNSKLNTAIRDMAEAYHATENNEYTTDGATDKYKGGALMMFTDIGLGEQSTASRGFDMKAWINDELVRLGVKPEHIAFMRDNKTHAKKGKLFDDMRQGRKRIMIGGKDMETGVNAQKRLTHLFHLDAPWFPASVEQREGRIIRQGNQNQEVVIKAYATKGSYDSTMWSMVARKARFIEQAMRGDATVRSMDDVSEASAFEQASALSSGDPRSLQLAGLRQDVERLNRQLSGYQNEKFKNQNQAKAARRTLARAERELDDINKLLPTHKTIATGDVIGQVNGKAFDSRADFGQAIIAEYNKHASSFVVGEKVLGTAAGYDVVYNGVMMDGGNFYADANINIPKADDAALFDSNNVKDVWNDGLTTRIVNRVNKLAEYKDKVQAVIEKAQTDAANFERRANKSFDSHSELEEKSRALKDLEDELSAESEALKAASQGQVFDLTDADRVPGSEAKYSKTNPAKGSTGVTAKQVIGILQNRFGKDVVASLIKKGMLRIRTLNDFVDTDGRLLVPSDAEGFYYDGKVTLIADNLTSETAVPTLLHELGGHAGIQNLLSESTYMKIMGQFDALVEAGNKHAVEAKRRADASTVTESEARDEYIPYLITEYAQTSERSGPIAAVKRFVNRVMAGVRTWVRNNTGADLRMTPNDITQLAERMVNRLANQGAIDSDNAINAIDVPLESSQSTENQIDTPAFKEWFGDSKIVGSDGEPLVVYHGTAKSFNEFNTTDFGALLGKGSYFTADQSDARQYSDGGKRIVPAYLSIKNPYYVKSAMDIVPSRAKMLADGYDGVVYNNEDGSIKWAVAHKPAQIKSATENAGTFDSTNNDIRFSRRYSNLGVDTSPTTAKEKAIDAAKQSAATALSSKFNMSLLLRRHLATPLHVGMLNPSFKTFFENVQARIAYENNEAGRIQEYMPEIWDARLLVGKKREAIDKVSRALFDGTMADKVWTDGELEANFSLDANQIDMYRRAREAIDQSVRNMTVDTLSSLAKGTKLVNIHTVNRLKLAGLDPIDHNLVLQQHMTDELQRLAQSGSITPAAVTRLQNQLDSVFDVMGSVSVKYDDLVEKGYAPLMRFGHYAVEVRDKSNDQLDLFELYETKGQQRKAIKELKQRYDTDNFEVGTGTLNPDAFKQFTGKGLSPETVQLFAAELGLDTDGAHQAYLKIAISNQSALKRLIHRKKVPGYSEDLPRVLSAFVMSNARYSGRALYNGEIERAIQKIEDGNLQGEAQNVFANMENPQEEFAGVRGLLFHYYMGFSTAFMVLNFTQPFTQTIPKLTAYVGAARAHRDMTQALGIITKYVGKATLEFGKDKIGMGNVNWNGFEDSLPAWVRREDYLRMTREGHLDPQNIWMIRGLERGKAGVISGLWGNLSRAAGWAAEVSETINRRGTMIAAFKVAQTMGDVELKAKGFNSRYDFAVSVIQQTQGVYNKGNRSGLARGTGKLGQFGPLVMVFKQFSINYAEQMIRHGRDKEVKSIAVAMTWQFLLAGALGLPFTDDLRDIVEGLLYRLFGRATNLTAFLQDELGKDNADALMYGLLSEKTRFDMYGRSNMGNFIPGTDFARPQEGDWAEVVGASSGFFENFFTAASNITKGQYADAAIVASPRYVRDAAAGIEIWNNGAYRNQKGDKVMDMDRTDAVIKGAFQFNPASNAQQGRERSEKYHMKNMVLDKQNQFALQLTEAIYQEDDDRVEELYQDMDAWNDRNPEHFNVDIDKIEESAERRISKKEFTSEDRQKLPTQLDEYFEERE